MIKTVRFAIGLTLLSCFGFATTTLGQVSVAVPKSRQGVRQFLMEQREFKSADGKVLATGIFDKIENGRAYINDGRETVRILLTDLSEEDQAYIRWAIQERKKREHADKVIKDSLYRLDISRPVEIPRGCRKLRTIGRYGSPAAAHVLQLIASVSETPAKWELFQTYIEICEVNEGSIRDIFATLNRESNRDLLARLESNPRPFLQSYAKLDDAGIEYLQFVAYRGRLLSSDNPPVAPLQPERLLSDDNVALQRRAAACEALGRIKTVASMAAILKLLEYAEGDKDNPPEDSTIRACLSALATLRMKDEEIEAALARNEQAYPDLVARAREKINSTEADSETESEQESSEDDGSDGGSTTE